MNTKYDGGPAFPKDLYFDEARVGQSNGMMLRDYFAAKALSGINRDLAGLNDVPYFYERIADDCYRMADAMLKAREQ